VALVRPRPDPPDVTFDEAQILAYLKKRDCICDKLECETYCFCNDIKVNLKSFQKKMGIDKIGIYRAESSVSKYVIYIGDPKWADAWAYYYDIEIPHHRHYKSIKKI